MSLNLEGCTPDEAARLVQHRPILVTYRGSVAHGMYVPPAEPTGIDDIDILGVYIPALRSYFGSHDKPPRGSDVKIREWDSATYELRHFVGLLCNGNPNVLATLWVKPESVIHIEREGEMLIAARYLFATKRAYHSFGGYAHSQLKRMVSFKDTELMGDCGCTGKFHGPDCAMAAERGRGSTKRFATGFMGEKRKQLVQRHGYDCKNAAHLVRLLRMGSEFLRTGSMLVDRREAGDADELLSIKRGEWTLERVKSHAEDLFALMREARDCSNLRDEPDVDAVDALLMDILCVAHGTEVVMRSHEVNMRAFGPRAYGTVPPYSESGPSGEPPTK
jgi:hypothetical protein